MGYMDPDHNDSLDFDEISEAVENAHNDSAEAKSDREVGVLISEVHRYMSRRRWKLINIHKQLDFDERGKIMVSDLREWLIGMSKTATDELEKQQTSSIGR